MIWELSQIVLAFRGGWVASIGKAVDQLARYCHWPTGPPTFQASAQLLTLAVFKVWLVFKKKRDYA